jgi:hypothetical protein
MDTYLCPQLPSSLKSLADLKMATGFTSSLFNALAVGHGFWKTLAEATAKSATTINYGNLDSNSK